MRKVEYNRHLIDDEIMKEGLCAASALEDRQISRAMSYVVGGVAVQSYSPTSCRRPTVDIDLSVLRPLRRPEFAEFSGAAMEFLRDSGYDVEMKKGHNSYQLIYSKPLENGNGKDVAVLEFARRNDTNFDRVSNRLNREYEMARDKIVEGSNITYKVCSPEDIAVPKIVRGVGSLRRHPEFCRYIESGKFVPLSAETIAGELMKIAELRDEAVMHVGDPKRAETLRFVSDLLDVRVLSETTGFNEQYLRESISSWEALREENPNKDLLFNYLLPRIF